MISKYGLNPSKVKCTWSTDYRVELFSLL